jgi:hypothetical protein
MSEVTACTVPDEPRSDLDFPPIFLFGDVLQPWVIPSESKPYINDAM